MKMKRRIIGMLLVVVMLVSALVSCGYSYAKEDLSKYVTFDKAELDAFLKNMEISDGDFTADEDTRWIKVSDSIYKSLASYVDTEDKKTEGEAGKHDVVYYCYYATLEKDGKEIVFFADQMVSSAADKNKLQLGLSDTVDLNKLIEEKLADYNFTDKAYSAKTSGTSASGDIAYVSYTVTPDVDEGETAKSVSYKYERVELGDADHDIAKTLSGAKIGEVYKKDDSVEFTVNGNTYSNAKIDWVVEAGEEILVKYTPYDSQTQKEDVSGTKHELEDEELTYHIYPVYYYEVEELSADIILKTIFSDITVETLPSFEGKEDEIKTLNDLKTALEKAESDVTDAEKAVDDAKVSLEDVEVDDPSETEQESIDAAKETLEQKENALKQRKKDRDEAQEALDEAIEEFYETVSAKTIVKEYEQSVYDKLLAEYNTEIKEKLAKIIWEQMLEKAEVKTPSNKAIKPVYDILIDAHRYTFSTGNFSSSDSSGTETNYHRFKGNFDNYLKYVEGVGDADVVKAKDKVWARAEAYVSDIFVIYYVAELYGQKLASGDMNEYKQELDNRYSGYYSDMVDYYGKHNVEAAVQFDKLMNYFLDWETDDDKVVYEDGKIVFKNKNIGYEIAE